MQRSPSRRAGRRRAAAWLCLALPLALAAGAAAQEPAPGAPGSSEAREAQPAVIPAAEVALRARELDELLRDVRVRARPAPSVAEVESRVAEAEDAWERLAGESIARLQQPSPRSAVSELTLVWGERDRLASEWTRLLADRIERLSRDLEVLDERAGTWRRTLERAREDALPPEVETTIRSALAAIEAARQAVRQRRNDLLALQSRVAQQQRAVTAVLTALDATRERLRGSLLSRDTEPLWRASYDLTPSRVLRQLAAAWSHDLTELVPLIREGETALENVVVAFLALLGALLLLRRRVRDRLVADPAFEATARVLARPASAAFLVLILLLPALMPSSPRLVRLALALVLVVPVLRLIAPLVDERLRQAIFVLVGWYLFGWVRNTLEPAPGLARWLLLVESTAAAGLFAWLLLPSRLARVGAVTPWLRVLGVAVRVGLALLSLAALANVVGNLSLAELLTEGTLFAAYIAVVLYGSGRVLFGVWGVLLRTAPLRLSRGVQRHEGLLRRRGARVIEVALVGLWSASVLARFDVLDRLLSVGRRALSASWPFGEIELSLSDLVVFGLTLWVALLLSRFVRFVLDEDVLPRTALPRGVPYAISSTANYLILLLGFVLAVSAAGLDMSRFALVVGALGVGIGIGLQDVVNNFVSGLILLFERPVQTGDIVELGSLSGEVRRIGMRSSTVRTWGGAEVIVPNSKLVSEAVINWTLSDRLRRIEIPIGVAYGTDPDRVIATLLRVAEAHPDVLSDPAPIALFLGHGDSSLDFELRVWTSLFEGFLAVRSQLTVDVNRALREAGIEIPFPQRDLHLRSVDPGLRGLLGRSGRAGEEG